MGIGIARQQQRLKEEEADSPDAARAAERGQYELRQDRLNEKQQGCGQEYDRSGKPGHPLHDKPCASAPG